MKRLFIALLGTLLLSSEVLAAPAVPAALKANCSKIIGLDGFIYKNSAPIRAGGVGTALIGYRKEPTLILHRKRGSHWWAPIYDSKGNRIGRCPWAPAHDTIDGRYRCTMQTGALRRTAVKNTRKPNIYFGLNKTTCVAVPDAGKCYGSVKGLCNRTIQ